VLAEAVLCMALTVHHEARGEPYIGREAVAHVLHNRAKRYGTGVCWEAFRYKQFSWTLHPSKLKRLPRGPEWEKAIQVSRRVLAGTADFTGGADHFHLVGLTPLPDWVTPKLEVIGQWGDHIFYRPRPQSVYNGDARTKRPGCSLRAPSCRQKYLQHLKEETMRRS